MILIFLLVNIVILLFSIVTVLSANIGFLDGIIVIVVTMVGINLCLLVGSGLTKLLESTIIKKIAKNRAKMFTLYDWLGKADVNIYRKLIEQKEIDSKDSIGNYNKVVEIIKKEFTTKDDLIKLKHILEVIQESPRIQLIKNSILTLFFASLTPAALQIINFFLDNKEINQSIYLISICLFSVLWVLLFSFIEFISKQSDRVNFLLKIVQNQLENY